MIVYSRNDGTRSKRLSRDLGPVRAGKIVDPVTLDLVPSSVIYEQVS